MSVIKSLSLCFILLMTMAATPFIFVKAIYIDELQIAVLSNKTTYDLTEPVNLSGNFTLNGQLVSNGTVGIAVYDPLQTAIAFRTVKTGPAAPVSHIVDFSEVATCDANGVPKTVFATTDSIYLKITLENHDMGNSHYAISPITLLDADGVPFATQTGFVGTLSPNSTASAFFKVATIPSWVRPGNATVAGSIFSGYPKDSGIPYCEEKRVYFEVRRNPQIGYSTPPATDPQAADGTFASSFRFPPKSRAGTYRVDVSAQSTLMNGSAQSLDSAQGSTSFNVNSRPIPPRAEFIYSPVDSYVNTVITFDASASTGVGYNTTITNYEWNFGDGSPKANAASPTRTHVFADLDNYLVTLNVTDNQGLWCSTSKYITVLNTTSPRADFSWDAVDAFINMTITFDASATTTQAYYVTIANYEWNFGDGSPPSSTSNPLKTHAFPIVGTCLVTLKVTDSLGLWYATSKTITILPISGPRADFMWFPSTVLPNETVTFDANLTKLGWNGTAQPAIVNYVWNFGDGNITSGFYPSIVHVYPSLGNYAVTLNVTDASGFYGSATHQVSVRLATLTGDINGDGVVNILDAIVMGLAFLSTPSSPNWNPNADLNVDLIINILDAIILGIHFGEVA